MERQQMWPVIGGALMALGAFLPWVQQGLFSLAGTSGDGIFTLVGGVIVVGLALTKRSGRVPGVIILLAGGVGVLVVWTVFGNLVVPGSIESFLNEGPQAGTGLYVAGLGSAIAALSGIDVMRAKPTAKQAIPSAPSPPSAVAAWEADPYGRHQHRYWNGIAWTEHVANSGVGGTDAPGTR